MCFQADRPTTLRLRRKKGRQVGWKVVDRNGRGPYYGGARYRPGRHIRLSPKQRKVALAIRRVNSHMAEGLYLYATEQRAREKAVSLNWGNSQGFKVLRCTYAPKDIIGTNSVALCVLGLYVCKRQPR